MIKNPFGVGSFKDSAGRFKQRGQNQHDFSGWADRLSKIEEGIGRLTEQFKNFQGPMEQEGMEKQVKQDPTGGITNLPQVQETGFTFDPQGGSLFDQLSTAYGQPATVGGGGMGSSHFTPGFEQFVGDQGYYTDWRPTMLDGPPSISETPIPIGLGGRMQGQQVGEGYNDAFNPDGTFINPPPDATMFAGGTQAFTGLPSLQGPTQQSIGSGINGLASLIGQQGYQV